ncbi:MAG: Spy/CpxP family protein refolding chaperone [Pseudomonadota bacterium]
MKKLIAGTLVSIGIAVAAPLVTAQTANPAAEAPQGQHAQRHPHGERAFRLPGERAEARLAYLKTALKITDAQQAQWNAFADVQRKHARESDQRMQERRAQMEQRAKNARPNAVERMEFRQKMLAVQSQRLGELISAGKPLYAALSPEQQKIADELLAPRGHGKFRGRGRHHSA